MKRNPMTLAATAVVALLFLLTQGASRASADINTETFDFTSCHVTGGCSAAPFGSVVLTQVGTSVQVVVTLTDAEFIKSGSGDSEAFKFVGLPSTTTITNGDITITSPTTPALVADGPGSFDGDGTGNFAFGIRCPSCGNGAAGEFAGPIDFTVANATIPQLTVANSLGFVFVADVIFTSGSGTGNTGPIDASTGVVPDGGMTLMLLGGALLGLETLRRKFRI
jgi:hypothetical protein